MLKKMAPLGLGDRIFDIVNNVLLALILFVSFYPLIFCVSASFSDPQYINSGQVFLFPKGFTTIGYQKVFEYGPLMTGYKNSLILVLIGTSINLAMTLTGAFALSRKELMGRNIITKIFIFTMFFNGGLIPNYFLVVNLHLYNTIWAMILPVAASMYNIIIARTFFTSAVPEELFDSAMIDGSTYFGIFLRILLPLSKPLIAVLALFYGMGHWNQFFLALLYLEDNRKYTLQLVLRSVLLMQELMMTEQVAWQSTYAQEIFKLAEIMKYSLIILASLPLLVAYPFVQKYFVKGVMIGSLKG